MSDQIQEWERASYLLYKTASEDKFAPDAVVALGRAGNSLVMALIEARMEIARLTASPQTPAQPEGQSESEPSK